MQFLPNSTLPNYSASGKLKNFLSISTFPPNQQLAEWWLSIPKPRQMRVEPLLCDHPYTRKRPIFNSSGCQLPGYMHPAAPRCQVKYLKWICDRARMPIDSTRGNGFVIPESHHAKALIPPQPWLITINNALVSMCGDIVSTCGIIHTKSNCMGMRQQQEAKYFRRFCNIDKAMHHFQTNHASNASFFCAKGSPWTQKSVAYVDRVFVVAEVDDTFVYHIHVEIMPRIILHLQFLLDNPDVKILVCINICICICIYLCINLYKCML